MEDKDWWNGQNRPMAGLAFCYLLQWMEGKGVVKLRVKWIGMNSFQGSEGGWSVQRSEEGNTVKAGIQCMVPSSTPPLPLEGRGALTHNTQSHFADGLESCAFGERRYLPKHLEGPLRMGE